MTKNPSDAASPADFRTVSDFIREHARARPDHVALSDSERVISWSDLNEAMNRVAASLQRDGVACGDVIATCATSSVRQAVLFLGALRAGVVVSPLAPSVTPEQMIMMLRDSGAVLGFFDAATQSLLPPESVSIRRISLGDSDLYLSFTSWLAEPSVKPKPIHVQPEDPFNIIYSSGTTGTPKGIVQSHGMRSAHLLRASIYRYDTTSVLLLGTPLYSNTTLVAFFPAMASGTQVHLMSKFDVLRYLECAQRIRATHTILVPVQYRRIMAYPGFGEFDLSSFVMKMCTSSPFDAALKSEVLSRWPGGLIDSYGMTEGGGSCILEAHLHRDKLHTVGRPAPGHDIRLLDEQGQELAPGPGVVGEVVGRSASMMTGYHGQPAKTRDAEWYDSVGHRFIRTGDVGRFDEDGFLILIDRRKDMIISGGFNIYPSDLESVLRAHPDVEDAAVVGMPSETWGETPVAFVVMCQGTLLADSELLGWFNTRVGKTQRLAALVRIDELPRSAIGKVLKSALQSRACELTLQD